MANSNSTEQRPKQFFLKVTSHDMAPRYCAGEYVFFEQSDNIEVGYEVLVLMRDQSVRLGRLVERSSKQVHVETLSPKSTAVIERGDISEMYPVLWGRKEKDLVRDGYLPAAASR